MSSAAYQANMESTETQVIDFEKICRLCLREKHFLTEIFEPYVDESYLSIDQKIMACASIEVSKNDGLPARICVKCLSSVNASFEFRLQCENSNKTLHNVKKLLESDIAFNENLGEYIDKEMVNKSNQISVVKKDEAEHSISAGTTDMLYFISDDKILEKLKKKNVEKNSDYCNQDDFSSCDNPNYEVSSPGKKKKKKTICLAITDEPLLNGTLEISEILVNKDMDVKKGVKTNHHAQFTEKKKLIGETVKVPCPYCNKRLARIDEHIRLLHRNRVYKCEKEGCGAKFSTLKNLQSHQLNCFDLKKAYKCSKCTKEFHRKSNFKAHVRRHGDNKDFQCQFCEKAFVDSTGLKRHFLKHHEPEQEVFISGCCGKKFKSKEGLKKHIQKSICGIQIFQIVSKENWNSNKNLSESVT